MEEEGTHAIHLAAACFLNPFKVSIILPAKRKSKDSARTVRRYSSVCFAELCEASPLDTSPSKIRVSNTKQDAPPPASVYPDKNSCSFGWTKTGTCLRLLKEME